MPQRNDVSDAITTWAPKRHGKDRGSAARIAKATRAVVEAAEPAWKSPGAAKLACGHVFRYLAWEEIQTNRGEHPDMVERYIDGLKAIDTPRNTLKATATALRHCFRSPRQPVERKGQTVAEAISSYTPDPRRVSTVYWDEVAELARGAVSNTKPTKPKQATSRLAPTTLYLAWSRSSDPQAKLFTPDSVGRFLEIGRSAWTPATHRTYTSNLRMVARAAEPALWPTAEKSQSELVICSSSELQTIARSIRGRMLVVRRRLKAIVLLARGAGITGEAAARVQPSDIDRAGGEVTIAVTSGRAARTVPVIAEWAETLLEVAAECAEAGDQHLLGGKGGGGAANRQSELVGRHVEYTGTAIDPRRLRLTWLAWLIRQPLGLPTILERAGLQSTTPLDEVLRAGPVEDTGAELTRIARMF